MNDYLSLSLEEQMHQQARYYILDLRYILASIVCTFLPLPHAPAQIPASAKVHLVQ